MREVRRFDDGGLPMHMNAISLVPVGKQRNTICRDLQPHRDLSTADSLCISSSLPLLDLLPMVASHAF